MRTVMLIAALAACRTPRERSPKPPVADASGVDAAPDAPRAVVYGPCDWNKPDPANPRCAPDKRPLMRCRDINGPSDRFPKCTEDNKVVVIAPKPVVLGIKRRGEVTDRGIEIIVDGGTNRGITERWRVDVIDGNERPLLGGGASITRVDAEETAVFAKLTSDQLQLLAKGVRFTPPNS